jgi:hypothetical protein
MKLAQTWNYDTNGGENVCHKSIFFIPFRVRCFDHCHAYVLCWALLIVEKGLILIAVYKSIQQRKSVTALSNN